MKSTVRASEMAAILGHKTVATIQNPEKNGDLQVLLRSQRHQSIH